MVISLCNSVFADFVSKGGCQNTRFFKEVGFIEEHLTSILALCKGEFEQACPTKSSHLCKTLCKGSQGDQCMLKC